MALLAGAVAVSAGDAVAQRAATRSTPPEQTSPAPPVRSESESAPDESATPDKPKRSVTAGHSWSDKPQARRRVKRPRRRYDPTAPNVTFPGFRLLPDGTSLIWVVISRRVPVDVHRAKARVTYTLQGADVHLRNNTHPLVTTHFNTPLARMRLKPHRQGAQLVVHLREALEPEHRVVDGPRGTMVLQVTLPRATRSYADQPSRTPLALGRERLPGGKARPVQPAAPSGPRR
jgi:hypothetical protein